MAVDIDESQFQAAVIDRSREVPVVVDFWAPWCGPCRQLTPALERAAEARKGSVELVKVNTDENPDIAMKYGIMSIPTIIVFKNGQVASTVIGAGPASMYKQKIDAALKA